MNMACPMKDETTSKHLVIPWQEHEHGDDKQQISRKKGRSRNDSDAGNKRGEYPFTRFGLVHALCIFV